MKQPWAAEQFLLASRVIVVVIDSNRDAIVSGVLPDDRLDCSIHIHVLRDLRLRRRDGARRLVGRQRPIALAMPHLHAADDGAVVTITSLAGIRPIGSSVVYAMSKAALNHMTRLLAKSQGPVRVNAVAPGLVATEWTADWDDLHALVAERAPAGRAATPDDCAEAVLALLRNRYVTGEVFVVDGGTSTIL